MGINKNKKSKTGEFLKKSSQDVLDCPHSAISVKRKFLKLFETINDLDLQTPLSKKDKEHLRIYKKATCMEFKNIASNARVNIDAVCEDLNKIKSNIDQKIASSEKPSLLLLGEFHNSAESFLIEISILSHLKQKKLANEILTETNSEGVRVYKNQPLSAFVSYDSRHFAYHALNYDLIGIDAYHVYNGPTLTTSYKREESMISELQAWAAKNSIYKVGVAIVGYTHLAPLKTLEQNSELNVITLNTAKPSKLERKLSRFNFEASQEEVNKRYQEIDSIEHIGLQSNIESLTFKQVIELFEVCESRIDLPKDTKNYITSNGINECEYIDNSYAQVCGNSLNNEL